MQAPDGPQKRPAKLAGHQANYRPAAPRWLNSLRHERTERIRTEEHQAMEGALVKQRVFDK